MFNPLLSGFIGGSIMFGTSNPVNSQINMYVMSRVIFGLARLSVEKGYLPEFEHISILFAGVTWALVMFLFEFHSNTLQGSLVNSMNYLYKDSNKWPSKSNNILKWLID